MPVYNVPQPGPGGVNREVPIRARLAQQLDAENKQRGLSQVSQIVGVLGTLGSALEASHAKTKSLEDARTLAELKRDSVALEQQQSDEMEAVDENGYSVKLGGDYSADNLKKIAEDAVSARVELGKEALNKLNTEEAKIAYIQRFETDLAQYAEGLPERIERAARGDEDLRSFDTFTADIEAAQRTGPEAMLGVMNDIGAEGALHDRGTQKKLLGAAQVSMQQTFSVALQSQDISTQMRAMDAVASGKYDGAVPPGGLQQLRVQATAVAGNKFLSFARRTDELLSDKAASLTDIANLSDEMETFASSAQKFIPDINIDSHHDRLVAAEQFHVAAITLSQDIMTGEKSPREVADGPLVKLAASYAAGVTITAIGGDMPVDELGAIVADYADKWGHVGSQELLNNVVLAGVEKDPQLHAVLTGMNLTGVAGSRVATSLEILNERLGAEAVARRGSSGGGGGGSGGSGGSGALGAPLDNSNPSASSVYRLAAEPDRLRLQTALSPHRPDDKEGAAEWDGMDEVEKFFSVVEGLVEKNLVERSDGLEVNPLDVRNLAIKISTTAMAAGLSWAKQGDLGGTGPVSSMESVLTNIVNKSIPNAAPEPLRQGQFTIDGISAEFPEAQRQMQEQFFRTESLWPLEREFEMESPGDNDNKAYLRPSWNGYTQLSRDKDGATLHAFAVNLDGETQLIKDPVTGEPFVFRIGKNGGTPHQLAKGETSFAGDGPHWAVSGWMQRQWRSLSKNFTNENARPDGISGVESILNRTRAALFTEDAWVGPPLKSQARAQVPLAARVQDATEQRSTLKMLVARDTGPLGPLDPRPNFTSKIKSADLISKAADEGLMRNVDSWALGEALSNYRDEMHKKSRDVLPGLSEQERMAYGVATEMLNDALDRTAKLVDNGKLLHIREVGTFGTSKALHSSPRTSDAAPLRDLISYLSFRKVSMPDRPMTPGQISKSLRLWGASEDAVLWLARPEAERNKYLPEGW